MAAETHLWWSMSEVAIGGGIVRLQYNHRNNNWVEKCGVVYTPSAVTDINTVDTEV